MRIPSVVRCPLATRMVLAACVLTAAAACRAEVRRPIVVDGNTLTLENQTADEWRGVEIWLNDHYRVTKPVMPPGERFVVPLDAFVAGFGQRFNSKRQIVQGIEVTATNARGEPVRLVHGHGRRR
ncbi:MAG: hypothetical protein AB1806_10860 [Acidobacteriota bacterium]